MATKKATKKASDMQAEEPHGYEFGGP